MQNYDAMGIFAHNVSRILAAQGINQSELARRLEMERTHLSRALRGENSPRLRFVERVAEQLSVDIRELFEPISEKVHA